uniref:WAP domain-containing protein n=1 Tax=Ornithorhynchus anatinus TaxID=9258 RepID=A0A6I8PGB8_ORNAN
MQPRSPAFLQTLFILCLEVPYALGGWKAGQCPTDRVRCATQDEPQCHVDTDCKGSNKCSHFNCGLKRLDPSQGTSWTQGDPASKLKMTSASAKP